jgi:hypothetical protein
MCSKSRLRGESVAGFPALKLSRFRIPDSRIVMATCSESSLLLGGLIFVVSMSLEKRSWP